MPKQNTRAITARVRFLAVAVVAVAAIAAAPIANQRITAAREAPPLAAASGVNAEVPGVGSTPINTPPTISVTPAPGEYGVGQQISVTVEYCDSQSLDTATKILRWNNVDQSWPTSYVIGNPGPCLARAVASGVVTMVQGTNVLRASIEDADPVPLWSGWSITNYTTPTPWEGVSVVPENQYLDATVSSATVQRFVVTNLRDIASTITLGADRTGGVPSVNPTAPAPLYLTAGASATVSINAPAPAVAYTTGRVILTATSGSQSSSAWTELSGLPAPTYSGGVTLVNPTGIKEKSLCLTISAGPGAAAECGDVRLAYALPGVRTKNKGRAPTLIYSNLAAHPIVSLPANFTLTSPTKGGATFAATVWITGGPLANTSYPAGNWLKSDFGSAAGVRRILASFEGQWIPTGRHPIRLDVAVAGSNVYSTTGELLMVNRASSPFNAGWWLAGLEQLVPDTLLSPGIRDNLLWVGGDGSARVFKETDLNSCVFLHEALDRPDSLVGTPSGGPCVSLERRTSNGLRVLFDASGNHVQTVNRLGETTTFAYSSGRLSTITLPTAGATVQYSFVYTNGVLDSIIAPAVPGQPRAVKFTSVPGAVIAGVNRPRTTVIRGPDLTTVGFGYEAGNGVNSGDYHIVSQTNRMGVLTSFGYDATYHLAASLSPVNQTESVYTTYRMVEGQGRGTGLAGQAIALDSAYTRLDGPRTDVADVSKWWVNKYGAPTRSRNAVGMETKITYDYAWPALPASVTDAAGVTTTALYNSRGLVGSSTVKSPFGGSDANTVITWDPKWDLPVTTTDPNGVVSTRTYDVANGNLLSERIGANTSRTTYYGYDAATKQLRTVTTPTIPVPDSIIYDGVLGNVERTRTPRGVEMLAYKDVIGRDTLVMASVDTILGTTSKMSRQRILYDAAGRVRETITSSPAMAYTLGTTSVDPTPVQAETLYVRTTFDPEGRPLTVNSFSRPNFGTWEQCGDPVGKCAGVPPGTEGSYDIRTYDYLGRPLTQRLGSGPMMVTYDPAGNVISEVTRNGHTITSSYDAANRLVKRITPSISHASEACTSYAYGILHGGAPSPHCWMLFPLYPTPGGTSLVIAPDTARFTFDAAGRMTRADNKDARISRSYYPAGALKTDTLRTRSYATSSFTVTVFGSSYAYDIGGRRVSHTLPTNWQLADGVISYGHEADRGVLKDVWHGTSHVQFSYDDAGRQDSLRVYQNLSGNETLGVIERRQYDYDGQLTHLNRVRREGGYYTGLLTNDLIYDARGKIRRSQISSAATDVGVQTSRVAYSGSGAVVGSEKWNAIGWEAEQFRTTAMGEVYRSRSDVGSQVSHFPMISAFDINGALMRKRPDLPAPDPLYTDTAYVQYDNAGNGIRSGAVFQRPTSNDRYYTATRNYYSADNKLVVVQRYHATDAGRTGAWEEFRYDALGRRVLSRSRRGDNGNSLSALCSGGPSACGGYVERTVWDGNQVLYELRADGGDSRTALQLDELTSSGFIWGKAGYVHAGGIDKPLVTMDGRVPTYNWRGLPESSVWTNGDKADCSLVFSGCTLIAWPSANSIYLKPPPPGSGGGGGTPQWVGTVLQDGAGSTGMLYRRNRFYDPGTGQFTQQDPIGIAGGANVYGFASGDPVNFSDPFGLCPKGAPDGSFCLDFFIAAPSAFGSRGDGRTFDANAPKSASRVQLVVSSGGEILDQHVSPSCSFVKCPAAPSGENSFSVSRGDDGGFTVNVEAVNSAMPGAPAINASVTFTPGANGVTISGTRDAFPSLGVYERTQGSWKARVQSPEKTPLSLIPGTPKDRFTAVP